MKGKINGKEFDVYGRNTISDAVTSLISEYLSGGYKIRPRLGEAQCDFGIDLSKDGEESTIRIRAYEFTERILNTKGFEPGRIIRYCGTPLEQKPPRSMLGPDSCRKVTISVAEYPSKPTREEKVLRRSGECISEMVFYEIPGQEAFVKDKGSIAEILSERIRRAEKRMVPAYYVLPDSAKPVALRLLKKRGGIARNLKPEKIGQVIHIYDHGICPAKFMVMLRKKNGNSFCTLGGSSRVL